MTEQQGPRDKTSVGASHFQDGSRMEPPEVEDEMQHDAVNGQEGLSKNARKRLIKLEQKDARKQKRKEEKKMRKQQRNERAAAGLSEALPAASVASNSEFQESESIETIAWATWRRLGSPRLVLAPMVNQSELAFRLLARRHGAQLTYTPMLHSTRFASEEQYRQENFDDHPDDRPLVAQFCGDDPATLLAAARYVQDRCDAVDLNCGCPQGIARRGHYGAFLLDEPDLIERIVHTLARGLKIPVFVKIRVLPSIDATLALAQRLEAAGCQMLTVHGRTREQKTGCACAWDTIALLKRSLRIPVVANGGVEQPEDLERCLAATKCDAVMTSEAALENPAMLGGTPTSRLGQAAVTRQYIELARKHPPRAMAVLKAHFFKLLFLALEVHRDLREQLGTAPDAEAIFTVAATACDREEAFGTKHPHLMSARCDEEGAPFCSWYRRHRFTSHKAESETVGDGHAQGVPDGCTVKA